MDWLQAFKKTQALRDRYGDGVPVDEPQEEPVLDYSPMKDEDSPEVPWVTPANSPRNIANKVRMIHDAAVKALADRRRCDAEHPERTKLR